MFPPKEVSKEDQKLMNFILHDGSDDSNPLPFDIQNMSPEEMRAHGMNVVSEIELKHL